MAQRESEREGVAVEAASLALTNGSMQAVTLIAEALTQPGDTVITEEVTYGGTIAAYRSLGIDMVGLPVDENGMRVELLEAKLDELGEGRRPKFIYALTTYQNPTGANLSLARRRALIDIAAERDIPIVEDNCYGDVHYDGDKPPALYALSDYENIVYVCSLSKILAPGLRLGYFIAKPQLQDTILARRHDAGGNTLAAAVVAELYKEGVWPLTAELNEALKVKKNLVVEGLAAAGSDVCVSSNPSGGLFVWVRLRRRRGPAEARSPGRRAPALLCAGRPLPHPRRSGAVLAPGVRPCAGRRHRSRHADPRAVPARSAHQQRAARLPRAFRLARGNVTKRMAAIATAFVLGIGAGVVAVALWLGDWVSRIHACRGAQDSRCRAKANCADCRARCADRSGWR